MDTLASDVALEFGETAFSAYAEGAALPDDVAMVPASQDRMPRVAA